MTEGNRDGNGSWPGQQEPGVAWPCLVDHKVQLGLDFNPQGDLHNPFLLARSHPHKPYNVPKWCHHWGPSAQMHQPTGTLHISASAGSSPR